VHSNNDSFLDDLYAKMNVKPLLCNTLSRIKFETINKTTKKHGLNGITMCVYAKNTNIKRKIEAKKILFDADRVIRQKNNYITGKLEIMAREKKLVRSKSLIAKVIKYILYHCDSLEIFCEDGRLLIDNSQT